MIYTLQRDDLAYVDDVVKRGKARCFVCGGTVR